MEYRRHVIKTTINIDVVLNCINLASVRKYKNFMPRLNAIHCFVGVILYNVLS